MALCFSGSTDHLFLRSNQIQQCDHRKFSQALGLVATEEFVPSFELYCNVIGEKLATVLDYVLAKFC